MIFDALHCDSFSTVVSVQYSITNNFAALVTINILAKSCSAFVKY